MPPNSKPSQWTEPDLFFFCSRVTLHSDHVVSILLLTRISQFTGGPRADVARQHALAGPPVYSHVGHLRGFKHDIDGNFLSFDPMAELDPTFVGLIVIWRNNVRLQFRNSWTR